MPRFAANISLLYPDLPFAQRFAAAARDGFAAVEFLFPYGDAPEELARLRQAAGVDVVLFNLPPGDWEAGDRGCAAVPGMEEVFRQSLDQALSYAAVLGCRRLHVMSGRVAAGLMPAAMRQTLVTNLRAAAPLAAAQGVTLLIEPLNARDVPGYFLTHQQQAHDIVADVGAPNVAVQMDFYHCQITEGDVTRRLERHLAGVGHVQIAGVPDRQEPDRGELRVETLLHRLDELGYEGYVGCEYRPAGSTSQGLAWLRPWRLPAGQAHPQGRIP